eukprot:COSAG01_NODE_41045_length_456_cov_1.431373_1_plen_24_part_01
MMGSPPVLSATAGKPAADGPSMMG